jgi:DNA replication protein DnaC
MFGCAYNSIIGLLSTMWIGDDVIASAILDRLLHHCHIIPTSDPSCRIKDKLEKVNKGD